MNVLQMMFAGVLNLALVNAAAAQAVQPKPVPPYSQYIRLCMASGERPKDTMDSFMGEVVLKASCECQFKAISFRRTITKTQWFAAARKCESKLDSDPAAFVRQYYVKK